MNYRAADRGHKFLVCRPLMANTANLFVRGSNALQKGTRRVTDPADFSGLFESQINREERSKRYAQRFALAAGSLTIDDAQLADEESPLPVDCQLQHPLTDLLRNWDLTVNKYLISEQL